jgi:hypothetical protein
MNDFDGPAPRDESAASGERRRTPLRRLLEERPEARPRLARAIAELIAATLVALVAIGALLIWHVMRRARLIRERLSAPRAVDLPDLPSCEEGRLP